MIDIYYDGWGNSSTNVFETMRMLSPDPVRSLGQASMRGDYLTCIAIQDFHVNAFTVFSPFSATIKLDRAKHKVDVVGDNILNTVKFYPDGSAEIQLFPQYIFRSDTSVTMQMLPPLLVPPRNDSIIAAGEFDISRWYRPLNTAFIVPSTVEEFVIKEGDPLFSIRFVTKGNEPVKLVRKALTQDEEKLSKACANLTYVKMGSKLSKLYEYFEIFKGSFGKNTRSRCPFHKK